MSDQLTAEDCSAAIHSVLSNYLPQTAIKVDSDWQILCSLPLDQHLASNITSKVVQLCDAIGGIDASVDSTTNTLTISFNYVDKGSAGDDPGIILPAPALTRKQIRMQFRRKLPSQSLQQLYSMLQAKLGTARNRPGDKKEITIDALDLYQMWERQGGLCAYTGVTMQWHNPIANLENPYNVSIDRIDSSQGYVAGNVHLVCVLVNNAKGSMSHTHFLDRWRDIVTFPN